MHPILGAASSCCLLLGLCRTLALGLSSSWPWTLPQRIWLGFLSWDPRTLSSAVPLPSPWHPTWHCLFSQSWLCLNSSHHLWFTVAATCFLLSEKSPRARALWSIYPQSLMAPLGILPSGLLLSLGFLWQLHTPAEERVDDLVMELLRTSYPANGPCDITQEDVPLTVFLHNVLRLSSA